MRLKQLVGVGLAVPLFTALAAADSQLTDVTVQSKANSGTVVVKASGALTHNEYRPVENLLLVDFPSTGTGKVDSSPHNVSVPGITSYQIHSYKAANGTDTARLELTLAPHAMVHFSTDRNAVLVTVSPEASGNAAVGAPTVAALSPAPAPAAVPKAEAVALKQPAQKSADSTPSVARVRGVSVVRGTDGTNVEIRSDAQLTPKVLTLKAPDRLVIDLANALPEGRPHDIPVHASDLEMVRMSRFSEQPPVTRVVLDLKAPQGFQVLSSVDKLTVKLHPVGAQKIASQTVGASPVPAPLASAAATLRPSTAVAASSPVPVASTVASASTVPAPGSKPAAQDYVVVQPEYHAVAASEKKDEKEPAERAASAAKVLGAVPPTEISVSSMPAQAAMKPDTMKTSMMQAAQTSAAPAPQVVSAPASGVSNCNTGRYTGEPISVNLKDVDLKDFFRLIHEISGLNVVLDPGVTGNLTIVLDDVPWDQALAIVLQNNSLQCQLSGNVLRIALPETLRKEADAIRATQEAQALAVDRVTVTRYLSYASAKNVVPTLKAFLSKRGDIIADDRTNSVIVQDIPSVIPGIDALIKGLDRKTQQVEIEARVVAATRSFSRDLGTQVGFGIGNASTAVGGASAVGSSPTQVTSGPPSNQPLAKPFIQVGTGQIPLFSNLPAGPGPTSGLTLLNEGSNYRLDVILTAAEQRGLLKILSRPRVVTQNNQNALVKQGVRIPVVTAAQLGGPPTTSYVDAFLRLQVTPQITAENTIFLNVDVENTTPNFGVTVQGNPELITQQATTQVLVADGGTVVIGGVIQTNDTITRQQVPFLGDVPVFGNLFKRKSVSTSTQELIFFITPRIVQS